MVLPQYIVQYEHDRNNHHGSQVLLIESQPGKIKGQFEPEVLLNHIKRLTLVEHSEVAPVFNQQCAVVHQRLIVPQLLLDSTIM